MAGCIRQRPARRWIKQRHNSVEQYLDSIGFNEGWRQRMRTALEPAVSCTSAESELC